MQILDTVYTVGYIYMFQLLVVSCNCGIWQVRRLYTSISDYMIVEHCHSNHLIPIIAIRSQYTVDSMYTALFVRNFPVNSKGLVNIHKTKSQMTYML